MTTHAIVAAFGVAAGYRLRTTRLGWWIHARRSIRRSRKPY